MSSPMDLFRAATGVAAIPRGSTPSPALQLAAYRHAQAVRWLRRKQSPLSGDNIPEGQRCLKIYPNRPVHGFVTERRQYDL